MKRLSGTLGIGLALVWGLLILVTGIPQVQAQAEYITSTSKVFLPLIWRGIDVPTAQWATQTKANSGIHLGNRNTDWQDKNGQHTFLDQVGHTAAGFWPAAVVVQSEQLYEFQRFDSLCQVSSARVKTIGGKDYELYRYLTEGVTHHHVKVVIRITPSPGNFSDSDHPGPDHVLLTTEAPPNGQNYCGDTIVAIQMSKFAYIVISSILPKRCAPSIC